MAALVLFLVTAAVVVWQNSRLGILWDLSYILENSYRISIGQVPYRDFPLAHAPLTFLIQAWLIKFTGGVFFHHVLYCAVVGGLATVLTWRILFHVLRASVSSAWLLSLFLSAPLTVLGIYCIFPHPFYDPDCTFAILAAIFLLQQGERKGSPPLRTFLTGCALVGPLFIKQNTGLAFLGSAVLAVAVLTAFTACRRRPLNDYIWLITGAAAGLAAVLLLIHLTAGLANYTHWTIQYATRRRMPPLADMLAMYRDQNLLWRIAPFLAGVLLLWLNKGGNLALRLLSSLLMAVPFAWTLIRQFLEKDSSDRAVYLLVLWPFVLIAALAFALLDLRRRHGIALVLPFILIATVQGAFLSQQLWGSTYAIWPLGMLLLADTMTALMALSRTRSAFEMMLLASVVALSMLVSGAFYVGSHERLDYAKLAGDVARPTLPALAGLSVPGPWIPQFEDLVRFSEREIPRQDGILMLPGEDLFYYSTGRSPQFPVLVFDRTVNPYTPDEMLEFSRSRKIRWLIIKRSVQLDEDPLEDKDRVLELLRHDFGSVKSLANYDVYLRK